MFRPLHIQHTDRCQVGKDKPYCLVMSISQVIHYNAEPVEKQ